MLLVKRARLCKLLSATMTFWGDEAAASYKEIPFDDLKGKLRQATQSLNDLHGILQHHGKSRPCVELMWLLLKEQDGLHIEYVSRLS